MSKLRTAQILMYVTITLLIVFQSYWLKTLYQEESNNFKTNTDLIFRETIYKLQGLQLSKDPNYKKGPQVQEEDVFMNQIITDVARFKDNSAKKGKGIFVYINTTDTELHKNPDGQILRLPKGNNLPIQKNIRRETLDTSSLIKKFTLNAKLKDSLSVKSIDSFYSNKLKKERISVGYQINVSKTKNEVNKVGSLQTQKVPVGFFNPTFYSANFESPNFYIIKKISYPIIFSLFLLSITIISFIFLYRNLVLQKRLFDIKNEFIGNITHELKTPISTVSVAIEAMKNFNVLENRERTSEYLDIAGLELNRLSMLVDKVLRLSMFESQKVDLKPQPFDIRELISEVVKSMRLQFEKFNADVKIHSTGLDFQVLADKMHISSVIYNLLDNALKYSDQNPQIECTICEQNENVTIKIKDNGIGIPQVYKEKVFEKFFRIPSGNQHNVKGYGLGLSYVSHIVEKHKGSINIEDNTPTGAIVSINLPKEYVN